MPRNSAIPPGGSPDYAIDACSLSVLQNDPADKLGEQGFDSETGEIRELKTGERRRRGRAVLGSLRPYRDSVHSKLGLSGKKLKATSADIQQQIPASRFGSPAELPVQPVLRPPTNVPSRREASWSSTAE
jgi:hypothetical protein